MREGSADAQATSHEAGEPGEQDENENEEEASDLEICFQVVLCGPALQRKYPRALLRRGKTCSTGKSCSNWTWHSSF